MKERFEEVEATSAELPPLPTPETKEPILGEANGSPFAINLGRLLATRALIQAASGGGKSYLLRRLLEQTHGMVQQIVVDPEGELVTLAEKFDYLVCAADSEVAPIQPESGAQIADLIFRSGRSAILSLGEFDIEEMQIFVADFIKALMRQPKENWRHCMVAFDEAAILAPQMDKAVSKKPMVDLAARGRKRGFCPIMATQRGSGLLKGVAANLDNKLIGLTTLDIDVERAAEQLGMKAVNARALLKRLQPGQFIAYGPALTYEMTTVNVGPVVSRHGVLGVFDPGSYKPSMPIEEVQRMLQGIAAGASKTLEAAAGEEVSGAREALDELSADELKDRVAAARHGAIKPLLSKGREAGSVQARAGALGVQAYDLHNWMRRFKPRKGEASLRPSRVRECVKDQLVAIEQVLSKE